MRKDFINAYKTFIEKWGVEMQSVMCIEEMSELIKALCKYHREKETLKEEDLYFLKEEIADVLNTAEQLEYVYGEEEIEKIREEKIARTLKKCEK